MYIIFYNSKKNYFYFPYFLDEFKCLVKSTFKTTGAVKYTGMLNVAPFFSRSRQQEKYVT